MEIAFIGPAVAGRLFFNESMQFRLRAERARGPVGLAWQRCA